MKNLDKVHAVSRLLGELQMLNILYAKDGSTVYFDYDGVIEQLHIAKDIIKESARAARPADLPEDMPWCEAMGCDEIDPYVYTGDMSDADFTHLQKLMGL
jgi:hypothetical protein